MTQSPSTPPATKRSQMPPLPFKGILVFLLILLLVVGGVVQFTRPFPPVEAKATTQSITLPGQLSVSFPDQGESAVGTENLGVIASTSDQSPVPIASVTKIMTAYLVLKAHPLKPGEEGPFLTMSAQDFAGYQEGVKNGHSVLKIAEGEQLTEKQMLEGLMLPSGDNIADTLGRWIAGSDQALVDKMNETAKDLGMTQTHYADASGVNPATVSNAVDQIKIAQAAMKDPIFREIVAMPQATLPVAGTVYNVNSMVGKHGIVGIKTGSMTVAGGNFVAATPVTVGSQTHYIISAVLGQKTVQSLQAALDANVKILDQVRPQFKLYPLTEPGEGFGQIITAWHSSSPLKATEPVHIFGFPGMKLTYSINLTQNPLPIKANQPIGTLEIEQAGQTVLEVPLKNSQSINPPGYFWRLIRS